MPTINLNFNFGVDMPNGSSAASSSSSSSPSHTQTQQQQSQDRTFSSFIDALLSQTSNDGNVRIQFHDLSSAAGLAGLATGTEENARALPFEQVVAHTSASVVDEDTPEICSICRASFRRGDVKRSINTCGHSFHLSCIERWLVGQRNCPICRQVIGQPPRTTTARPWENTNIHMGNGTTSAQTFVPRSSSFSSILRPHSQTKTWVSCRVLILMKSGRQKLDIKS